MSTQLNFEELVLKYLSGGASDVEIQELKKRLDRSPERRKTFAQIKKTYTEVSAHFDDSLDIEASRERLFKRIISEAGSRKSPVISLIGRYLKYAAIILLFLSTGITAYLAGKRNIRTAGQGMKIEVPYGSTSSVILPDGSNIWLNAGSQLSYDQDFNLASRDVYLVGEGLFNVEKKNIPFIVHTSHMDVYVTGTTFNVKSYPDEERIETTVLEGEVRILTESASTPIYIKPNQRLNYNKRRHIAEVVKDAGPERRTEQKTAESKSGGIVLYENINAEEIVSWQSGVLHIEGEKLVDLARKLERKFDVNFSFEDEQVKQYTYSGTILDFPLEQVLEAIKLTSPVDYEIHEKTVTLSIIELE
jgi:transmembrane sensor